MTENPGREFHAIAGLFPLLRGGAFEELVADIRDNGLREPILIDADGRILDGRNRYRACLEAGVEPRFVQWEGEGPLEKLALSLSRARAGSKFATRKPLKTHDEAAGMVNISPRLVIHALRVMKDGCPELIAAVESGGMAVSTASILAGLPEDEQAQAAAGGVRHARGKAREIRAGKSAASAPRCSPGRFGVLRAEALGPGENSMVDRVMFLWVSEDGLYDAVEALEARGFQNAGSGPPWPTTNPTG